MLVRLVLVAARELLEQLQGGGLGGRRGHLAAAEVLELRVEAGVDGDLVAAGVLEDDRGPAALLDRLFDRYRAAHSR